MNSVTVSGRLQADPVIEHVGDLAGSELRLVVEWPSRDGQTACVDVTCSGRLAVVAVERLRIGDYVGVIGWLRAQPAYTGDSHVRQRVDVVAERLDFLGHPTQPKVAGDAHLEAAYEDRYEPDEGS
jgi:single-stranded DNA-binding protein